MFNLEELYVLRRVLGSFESDKEKEIREVLKLYVQVDEEVSKQHRTMERLNKLEDEK